MKCFRLITTQHKPEIKNPPDPHKQLLDAAEEQLNKWDESRHGKRQANPLYTVRQCPNDLDTANASKGSRGSTSSSKLEADQKFSTLSTCGQNVSQVGFQIGANTAIKSPNTTPSPTSILNDINSDNLNDPSAHIRLSSVASISLDATTRAGALSSSAGGVNSTTSSSRPISMLSSQLSRSLKRISGSLKRGPSNNSAAQASLPESAAHTTGDVAVNVMSGGGGGVGFMSLMSMSRNSSTKYLPAFLSKELTVPESTPGPCTHSASSAATAATKTMNLNPPAKQGSVNQNTSPGRIAENSLTMKLMKAPLVIDHSTNEACSKAVGGTRGTGGQADAFLLSPHAPLWLPGLDYDVGCSSPNVEAATLFHDPQGISSSGMQLLSDCSDRPLGSCFGKKICTDDGTCCTASRSTTGLISNNYLKPISERQQQQTLSHDTCNHTLIGADLQGKSSHVLQEVQSRENSGHAVFEAWGAMCAPDVPSPYLCHVHGPILPSDTMPSESFGCSLLAIPEATGGCGLAHSLTPAPQRILLRKI
ncbi:hypothetical protein CEUSTIGMA_g7949.t1 [Chlamydomonas eustigma]|uniref:Uncharacterized protein n=1 Tax=Chlamydomonas eustigma TaxID=1157962 RepID=A0A250XBQ3_9CHLO|nr:hypothetical protein CEUSTIGMA_g7949.t1 [Chlamydomonas eustigma]|eukprot:GAX80511.1 hypothetical protein CEUSTIGMA_g7949.t1 [Chlamydomonas eustigma]